MKGGQTSTDQICTDFGLSVDLECDSRPAGIGGRGVVVVAYESQDGDYEAS